ncbi:hypothetical protein GGI20_006303, partial [Coemansia sp. BCRC 34301]
MKFGETIETSARELPAEWQPYLIQYNELKKNIKNIVEELDDTFRTLNWPSPAPPGDTAAVASGEQGVCSIDRSTDILADAVTRAVASVPSPEVVAYNIEKDSDGLVHPVIIVKIRRQPSNQRQQIVELPDIAGLPRNTSIVLPSFALQDDSASNDVQVPNIPCDTPAGGKAFLESKVVHDAEETQVTVRLQSDQMFFVQLINYIERIRAFEQSYTQQYASNVSSLGSELTFVTSPFKHDFQIWREIFRLYIDAE